MIMNMAPPLLVFVSFCMLGLCFLWQKNPFHFKKKGYYVSLFAKLYYLLRLGPHNV